MRRFLLRWAWAFALLALGTALLLRQFGGYWNIKYLAGPPPKLPATLTGDEGETKAKEEVPPVQGDISDDTRKALEKHREAQKKVRQPPH